MHRVAVSAVAIGASPTSARKVYRTAVGGSQLKLQQTIANNTATVGVQDATPDGSLGADAPTADTSGLTQPSGQVNAGSSSLLTASAGPFQANGGWAILSGGQVVRYTGVSGNTLTGIPTSGVGSITTTVLYGSQVLPSPALTGVNAWNGLTLPMAKGSAVHIWVQRDDLAAQAALAALEGLGGDGIREYTITDERRGEASLIAVCDADLALFSRPAVSVDYYTRDPKSRTGRIVHLDLTVGHFDPAHFDPTTFEVVTGWGLTGEFRITSVDITFDGPALRPRYHVKASSVPAFTFGDVVRKTVLS